MTTTNFIGQDSVASEKLEALEIANATSLLFSQRTGRPLQKSDCPLLFEVIALNVDDQWQSEMQRSAMLPHYCVPVENSRWSEQFCSLPPLARAYALHKARTECPNGNDVQ